MIWDSILAISYGWRLMLTKPFMIYVRRNLKKAITNGKATNNIVYFTYCDENWLQSGSELNPVIDKPKQ